MPSESLSPTEFVRDHPLYERLFFTPEDEIPIFSGSIIDIFCPYCRSETPYSYAPSDYMKALSNSKNGIAHHSTIEMTCRRNAFHRMKIFVLCGRNIEGQMFIEKVGQHPSAYSIAVSQESKIMQQLGDPFSSEYRQSIICASHGFNVAAFTYMRRVMEFLIEREWQEHESKIDYDKTRIYTLSEKSKLLYEYLPEFLRENIAVIYSILSTVIHQISDSDAAEYYAGSRRCVRIILEDEMARAALKRERADAAKDLGRIASKIGGAKDTPAEHE